VITTTGSDLLGVFDRLLTAAACDDDVSFLDWTRVTCSSAIEVQSVLGVEAARQCILDGLIGVMEDRVALVHLQLIADMMTYRGGTTSFTSTGISE
jgi:hypothetical protein